VDRGGPSSGTWHSHGLPDVALAAISDMAHPERRATIMASTGSGATWDTLLALCSPVSLLICWECERQLKLWQY
jgi:hypothetical protein